MKVPSLLLASLFFFSPLAAKEKIRDNGSPLSRNYKHASMFKRFKASPLAQEESGYGDRALIVRKRSDKLYRMRNLIPRPNEPVRSIILIDALAPRTKPLVSKYRPGRVTTRNW